LGQPVAGGGVRTKPHLDPEVTKGYLETEKELQELRRQLREEQELRRGEKEAQ